MQKEVEEAGNMVGVKVRKKDGIHCVELADVVQTARGPRTAVEEQPVQEGAAGLTTASTKIAGAGSEEVKLHPRAFWEGLGTFP